jgi:hypothetical protein
MDKYVKYKILNDNKGCDFFGIMLFCEYVNVSILTCWNFFNIF